MYVSPEQMMLDRAEFARKGIARGRAVAVLRYADGNVLVAGNHSTTLDKVAEVRRLLENGRAYRRLASRYERLSARLALRFKKKG